MARKPRTRRVSITLSEDEWTSIEDFAGQKGRSPSNFVRLLFSRVFEGYAAAVERDEADGYLEAIRSRKSPAGDPDLSLLLANLNQLEPALSEIHSTVLRFQRGEGRRRNLAAFEASIRRARLGVTPVDPNKTSSGRSE